MEMVPTTEGDGGGAIACDVAGAGVSTAGDDVAIGLGSGGVFSHAARAPRKGTRARKGTSERCFMAGAKG
jgi:hypothetical protein